MTVLFCMGNLRITSVSQRCLDRLQRAIAQKNPLAVRNSIILFTMLEYRCGTRQKIGKLNTKRGLVRPTTHRAHYRPSRGLPVASCAWQLSLAGPAVAGRLCGSSGQSSLAPSMLSQLLLSALLIVLRADTTAPSAQYWAQQDAAAAAAKQGLQRLARIVHQYVRHMDVDCATMRLSRVLTRARAM